MRKYNISANLVPTIEKLYDKAKVQFSEWQCGRNIQNNRRSKARMSSVIHHLYIFLERIMSDSLENMMIRLEWAIEIVERHHKTCTRYKMNISAKKTKPKIISANGIQRGIKVK